MFSTPGAYIGNILSHHTEAQEYTHLHLEKISFFGSILVKMWKKISIQVTLTLKTLNIGCFVISYLKHSFSNGEIGSHVAWESALFVSSGYW